MKKGMILTALCAVTALLMPVSGHAQGGGAGVQALHLTLESLYDEMLPLCSQLINVGRAIAGFAALWYIAVRVWRQIANAEAIEFYSLLRPFALGLAILLYPMLLELVNGVMKPISTATANMVDNPRKVIDWHIEQEKKTIQEKNPFAFPGTEKPEQWQKYEQPDGVEASETERSFLGLSFQNLGRQILRFILEVLFIGAALCIDTLRTFYLIIMSILGPLVLGFSVFDGFQHTLNAWIARYINVYLWLPIANIFGAVTTKIQENMIVHDQDAFSSFAYLVFMFIAVVGYFTIPTIASHIVQVGGKDGLVPKVSSFARQGGDALMSGAGQLLSKLK